MTERGVGNQDLLCSLSFCGSDWKTSEERTHLLHAYQIGYAVGTCTQRRSLDC